MIFQNILFQFLLLTAISFFGCISGSRPGILGDFWQVIPTIFPNSMQKSSLLFIVSTQMLFSLGKTHGPCILRPKETDLHN